MSAASPPAAPPPAGPPWRLALSAGVAGLIAAATLAMYQDSVRYPEMLWDDWDIVEQSWTWQSTVDGLWVPQNEHAMPPGRVLTYLLVRLARTPDRLPRVLSLVGPLSLLPVLVLLYLFVRRELGHPLYGFVAAALFGVTAVYQQAVWWFASAFSIVSLVFMLLGLLAAQSWRRTGRVRHLFLALLWCLAAPAWFGSGVLAGPLCAVYLLGGLLSLLGALFLLSGLLADTSLAPGDGPEAGRRRGLRHFLGGLLADVCRVAPRSEDAPGDKKADETTATPEPPRPARALVTALLAGLAPLLGTALFLAVSLPRTADKINHLRHYGKQTAVESFDPLTGLVSACRSIADNLIPGAAGITVKHVPWKEEETPAPLLPLSPRTVVLVLAGALAVGVWWCWGASARLCLLGVALILANYWLIYSARAGWAYDKHMIHEMWTRYHLLPQLGVALLVAAGLRARAGRWCVPRPDGLSVWQAGGLALLVVVLFAVQEPRAHRVQRDPVASAKQQEQLRRVAETDARCRRYHISADTARKVLPRWKPLYGEDHTNAWDLLRGSDDPHEMSDDEARRLLTEEEPNR